MEDERVEDENRRHDTLFRTIESLEPTSTVTAEVDETPRPAQV